MAMRPSYYVAYDIRTHPKTRRLAKLLEVEVPTAIGLIHSLWSLAVATVAEAGDLEKSSIKGDAEELAHQVGWSGEPDKLVDAFRQAGWLDGWVIHDWSDTQDAVVTTREAGRKGGKRSGQTRKRQAEEKEDEALREALPEALTKHRRDRIDRNIDQKDAGARAAPAPAPPAASAPDAPAGGAGAKRSTAEWARWVRETSLKVKSVGPS
jgi:hypothetical protein